VGLFCLSGAVVSGRRCGVLRVGLDGVFMFMFMTRMGWGRRLRRVTSKVLATMQVDAIDELLRFLRAKFGLQRCFLLLHRAMTTVRLRPLPRIFVQRVSPCLASPRVDRFHLHVACWQQRIPRQPATMQNRPPYHQSCVGQKPGKPTCAIYNGFLPRLLSTSKHTRALRA